MTAQFSVSGIEKKSETGRPYCERDRDCKYRRGHFSCRRDLFERRPTRLPIFIRLDWSSAAARCTEGRPFVSDPRPDGSAPKAIHQAQISSADRTRTRARRYISLLHHTFHLKERREIVPKSNAIFSTLSEVKV